jgi:hypothetical protein
VERESERPDLFVLATGQDDNLGDVVLRREYFDRLRALGDLHLFVGNASADFIDGLRLHEADEVYVTLRQWHSVAWRALFRGRVWFVDKPGELQLDRGTFRRHLKLLPLIVGIRLRNGQVLRLGMAMRAPNPLYLRRLRPLFRLSTMILWRDTATRNAFRFGAVGPDWAFRWDDSEQDALDVDRTDIAISYRGDREPPSEAILTSLDALARDGARRLVVVTQVRRDEARSSDLASRLGAELITWPAARTSVEQEAVLRKVYRNSAAVVSDRLHALIVGMTEGAVPLCITDEGESKVGRHFDAVGFERSTVDLTDATAPLTEVIERQIGRRAEALQALREAQARLDGVSAQLAAFAPVRQDGDRTP